MKRMKKLTKLNRKQITMRSLPVVILAAIAFISVPSLLPETADGMKRSVAVVECSEQYEIIAGGKTVAFIGGIKADSTLQTVREKADSDTERKAMVCGCWMNRYSFLPYCNGRILTADPFDGETDLMPMARRNIRTVIKKTIEETEDSLETNRKRTVELDYYLDTHSVKDEGYNTMAAYADENRRRRASMEKALKILEGIKDKKGISIRRTRSYTLLYADNGRKIRRVGCRLMENETQKLQKGALMLQTEGGFMPEAAGSSTMPLLPPPPYIRHAGFCVRTMCMLCSCSSSSYDSSLMVYADKETVAVEQRSAFGGEQRRYVVGADGCGAPLEE